MYNYIKSLKDKTPLNDELYFKSLVNGAMSFDVFKKSQINFYSAVCYFPRPLFMLCARIDSYSKRLSILENIFDEHGNGDVKKSHGETYKQYLINLGTEKDMKSGQIVDKLFFRVKKEGSKTTPFLCFVVGGERGIRTVETPKRLHAFQICITPSVKCVFL